MADYRAQRLARIRADYERFTAHSNQMTENNFTPPPDLVEQWMSEYYGTVVAPGEATTDIANRAAQWGADQELKECIRWLHRNLPGYDESYGERLRDARRPKPPSVRVMALEALEDANLDAAHYNIILRALEQLPE
jgi:hypothetical protein